MDTLLSYALKAVEYALKRFIKGVCYYWLIHTFNVRGDLYYEFTIVNRYLIILTNIKKLCKARKVKWHRKYTYKSVEDLIKHITAFYERVMECVEEYTGGYPYKQGNGWTDPQMNKEMIC